MTHLMSLDECEIPTPGDNGQSAAMSANPRSPQNKQKFDGRGGAIYN
jgi:hypothetical protein